MLTLVQSILLTSGHLGSDNFDKICLEQFLERIESLYQARAALKQPGRTCGDFEEEAILVAKRLSQSLEDTIKVMTRHDSSLWSKKRNTELRKCEIM